MYIFISKKNKIIINKLKFFQLHSILAYIKEFHKIKIKYKMDSGNKPSFHSFWNEVRLREASYETLFIHIEPLLKAIEQMQTYDRFRITETDLFLHLKNVDLFHIKNKEKESKSFLCKFFSVFSINSLFELLLGFMLICQFSANDFPQYFERLIKLFRYNKFISIHSGEYKFSIEEFVKMLLQAYKIFFEKSYEAELIGLKKDENEVQINELIQKVNALDIKDLGKQIYKDIFADGTEQREVNFEHFFENVFPNIKAKYF